MMCRTKFCCNTKTLLCYILKDGEESFRGSCVFLLLNLRKVGKDMMKMDFGLQAAIHEQVSNYLHPCQRCMPIICWTESALAEEVNHA